MPLIRDNQEEDIPEVEIYRKQKQRDFERKEEEKKKAEMQKKKLAEIQKQRNSQEEELNKKVYTYDSKGDIVFIKSLNVDGLSKEVNFEMKYNLKKLPQNTKGIYSFDAGTFKKRKNSTLKPKEEESLDPNKEYKKGKIVSKVSAEVLASGKDLKKAFAGIKGV